MEFGVQFQASIYPQWDAIYTCGFVTFHLHNGFQSFFQQWQHIQLTYYWLFGDAVNCCILHCVVGNKYSLILLRPALQNGSLVSEQLCSISTMKETLCLIGRTLYGFQGFIESPQVSSVSAQLSFSARFIHHSFWISGSLHWRLLHANWKASFLCGQDG